MNTGDGCANDPGVDRRRATAKCHICGEVTSCGFCNLCCHWFCRTCNPNIFARAIGAVKELVGGPRAGCCGPVKALFNLELCDVIDADEGTVTIRSGYDASPIIVRRTVMGLIIDPTEDEKRRAIEHIAMGAFGVLP